MEKHDTKTGTAASVAVQSFPAMAASLASMPSAPMPVAEETPSPKRVPRIRRTRTRSLSLSVQFNLALEGSMYLGLLATATLLWYWDGRFTLTFLSEHFPQLLTWGLYQWLIPVIITICTLASWPGTQTRTGVRSACQRWENSQHDQDWQDYDELRRALRVKVGIFMLVGLFNLGTTFSGLLLWGAGRKIDLFVGFAIPATGWGLWVFAGLVGLCCSYGPEKITRWSMHQLGRVQHSWKRGRV